MDEIGVATAREGGLVLRSAFQLVYRRSGDVLRAVAAEGFVRPSLEGEPIPPRRFLEACGERRPAARLCALLHMRNHAHAGFGGLDLVVAAGVKPDFVAGLARDVAAAGLDPARLVCAVRNPVAADMDGLVALAEQARAIGARIAIAGAADGGLSLDAIRRIEPDIVRIDGFWFRTVAQSEAALRLTARLVDGFREQGAQVFVEGIETQRHLAAALYADADLFQGYLLSRPQPAAAGGDVPTPLPLSSLFRHEAKVIPLRIRG